ncbi:MAG: hypothetical protein ACLRNQ_06095 [Flavonifractor plautii]
MVSSLVSALSGPLVDAGYDITILAVAISLSSMVAYLTYASSGQATILLSQKNMDNKFIWTYGIAAMLALCGGGYSGVRGVPLLLKGVFRHELSLFGVPEGGCPQGRLAEIQDRPSNRG